MQFIKPITDTLRPVLGPPFYHTKSMVYAIRFHSRYNQLLKSYPGRIQPKWQVAPESSSEAIWTKLKSIGAANVSFLEIPLDNQSSSIAGNAYWDRFKGLYQSVGNGREKALEHSLTFSLIDFAKVRRYCDVASSQSPISSVLLQDFSKVEYWRQDLEFETDLDKKVLGGFAQDMKQVPNGFFDAMALHCSFEHFMGKGDSEFIAEVDRVLSPEGVCLILPLYLDGNHKIFFDPTTIPLSLIKEYDQEAVLCPAYDYRQEHGRYYGHWKRNLS
jgi:hypothetical protein